MITIKSIRAGLSDMKQRRSRAVLEMCHQAKIIETLSEHIMIDEAKHDMRLKELKKRRSKARRKKT